MLAKRRMLIGALWNVLRTIYGRLVTRSTSPARTS
jgi:hypothetical protein